MIKNKKRVLLLIIFVFLFLGTAAPQCPLFKKSTIFKDGGVFKSEDGGLTWQTKYNLIPPPGSKAKSMDIGMLNIISIAVDPVDDKIVYAGSEGNGLFRTQDGGENWELYNGENMRAGENIYDVAIDPKDTKKMYAAGLTAVAKGRVLKSEDAGLTWIETYVTLTAGDLVNKIKIDNYNTSIVYIVTSSGAVLQSTDYGRSWLLLGEGRFKGGVNNFVINPKDTRVLYITTLQEGLFKSLDKGVTWLPMNDSFKAANLKKFNLSPGVKIDILVIDPENPDTLYLGFINGMLKTLDGGKTWNPVNIITQPAVVPIVSLTIDEQDSENIFYGINSQIYSSNNAGVDWFVRDLPTTRVLQVITLDPKKPGTVYVGTKIPPKKRN